MPHRDWNEHYATQQTPWDTGEPDPHLVELVEHGVLQPGRALEIGCGTGTNALWLAEHGFEVVGIDVSTLAIEQAEDKRGAQLRAPVRFEVLDFLKDEVAGGPFDLAFDRGVLHVFDEAEQRARFARRVAALLGSGGHWLSLAGSTEGPPRDYGPPRRTARDLLEAVEPVLELVELRSITFDVDLPSPPTAWRMLARVREASAQPSSHPAG